MENLKKIGNINVGVCYNKKGKKYYTVTNTKGEYENHAHFNNYQTALSVAKCVNEKKLPNKKCLFESCIRISTNKNYIERLRNHKMKDRYYNQSACVI